MRIKSGKRTKREMKLKNRKLETKQKINRKKNEKSHRHTHMHIYKYMFVKNFFIVNMLISIDY